MWYCPKTFIELDNTYKHNQQYDDSYSGASTKYKASFALVIDKVYLEIWTLFIFRFSF